MFDLLGFSNNINSTSSRFLNIFKLHHKVFSLFWATIKASDCTTTLNALNEIKQPITTALGSGPMSVP